jgi:hypothetical protein
MKHRLATLIAIWCAGHATQAPHQQGGGDEQPAFHRHGHADRQASAEQTTNGRAMRPIEVIEQLQIGEAFRARQIQGERQRLRPHHDRGGDAQTTRAELRKASHAVGHRIAQRHQHQQAAETEQHRRQCPVQTIAEVAHGQVQREPRHAPADAVQERDRARTDFRCDAHWFQCVNDEGEEREQHHSQHRRQPQALAEQRADFMPAPGAIEL